ncbi:MAG TPA: glycan-binding surface protein [Parafilimonas sp.]|nr:glycan-binding surface protein [Parafilimonas sp.]
MKSLNKILLIATLTIAAISMLASCKKDDVSGPPVIHYVRITDPASSDSLLAAAGQGQLIAIMGENLGATQQVWFNDQKATLTPTYITNTSILVSVPSQIPIDINNKVKLIFKSGDSLLYDFTVSISKPAITAADCEYVPEGGALVIHGNYFYAPVKVEFTGGIEGEVTEISSDNDLITVKVPAGAQPGPVTITTNFGVTKSDFWFNDNRNIFIGSDPFEGWNNASLVVTNPGAGDPPKINGNYFRIKKSVPAWDWNELADGDAGSMPSYSKNIPDDAILHPEKYYLKFEINTMKPYNNSMITINAGGQVVQDTKGYKWAPPYDSKGQWQTVAISYNEVVAQYSKPPVVNPNGYWAMVLLQGPGDLDADMSFDNFRVVPKVDQ